MRKIAVANRKGGVGKTTSAVHLTAGLALSGRKVLLIDSDGQGHAARLLGVSPDRGLADLMEGRLLDRFPYLVRKLHAAGKLRARYSVHDLRHAFAVRLYHATHDVYQVEKALGHANVSVTETYLRSLGVEEGV